MRFITPFIFGVVVLLGGCTQDRISVTVVPKETIRSVGDISQQGHIDWQLPKNAVVSPGSGFRYATIDIPFENTSLSVSVTRFPGEAGGILGNVNRWRSQIKLPAVSQKDIDQLPVLKSKDGHLIYYVVLTSETEGSVIGGILPLSNETLFFKINGKAILISRFEPQFKQFLESVVIK